MNFYIDEPAPFVLSLDSITPLNCFADTDSEVWISWNGGQFGFTNGIINSPNFIARGLSLIHSRVLMVQVHIVSLQKMTKDVLPLEQAQQN